MRTAKLRNLNELNAGIHKRWPLKSKSDYHKVCDFLQKINFCIQDLNAEIQHSSPLCMKDIIFTIVQTDWIIEAFEQIQSSYKTPVLRNFSYGKEDELQKAKKYLRAIRSFIVAHPLTTDRHPIFGFDGDLICVDIRTRDITFPFIKNESFYHLNLCGIESKRYTEEDFYLYAYSEKADNMRFFKYIGCSLDDVYSVVDLYVDKLYALAKYLDKQKKVDYSEVL